MLHAASGRGVCFALSCWVRPLCRFSSINWILGSPHFPVSFHPIVKSVAPSIGPRLTQIPMQLPPLPLTSYQNTSLLLLFPLFHVRLFCIKSACINSLGSLRRFDHHETIICQFLISWWRQLEPFIQRDRNTQQTDSAELEQWREVSQTFVTNNSSLCEIQAHKLCLEQTV